MTKQAFDKIEAGLKEALELLRDYEMTPAEIEAQRQSWVRGMTARCEHGVVDFEQCSECRSWLNAKA